MDRARPRHGRRRRSRRERAGCAKASGSSSDPSRARPTDALPDESVAFEVLHVDDDDRRRRQAPGLVVHPARGHEGGTLVNGLLARGLFRRDVWGGGADDAEHVRPGIVHRLDKGTSGVMVVARTAARARGAEGAVSGALHRARVRGHRRRDAPRRRRSSTLHGRHPRDRLRFTTRVARGKRAVTHVRVLGSAARRDPRGVHARDGADPPDPRAPRPRAARRCSAIRSTASRPRTRSCARSAERLGHQALHARVLGFVHPGRAAPIRFEAPPPADFARGAGRASADYSAALTSGLSEPCRRAGTGGGA